MSDEPPNPEPVPSPVYDEALWREHEAQVEFVQQLKTAQPRATIAIIAACGVVFLLEGLWNNWGNGRSLLNMGALLSDAVDAGQWWRLWANTFLHYGPIHILGNMVVLWSLRYLEAMLGSWRFLIIYALSGLGGSAAFMIADPNMVCAGASGAVWGVLTAMMALTLRPHGLIPAGIAKRVRGSLTRPLVINLALSFLPGVGLWAHVGGGVVGFLLVYTGLVGGRLHNISEIHGRAPWFRQVVSWVAIALGAAMLISVGWAILAGHAWTDSLGSPSDP